MAETVGSGPAVGGITGLALGLSPPHAARIKIKTRITPIIDTPGRERAARVRSKKVPPLIVDVDLPVNSIAFGPANHWNRNTPPLLGRSPLFPVRVESP